PASSDSGTMRSPVTTSTFAGSIAAASERCVRARTGTPASISRSTTARPTRPVAPVTSTGGTRVRVMRTSTSSVAGARSEPCHPPGSGWRSLRGVVDGLIRGGGRLNRGVVGGLSGLEYGVAFNELAAFEAGPGADERDEVGCVDGAPAFLGGVDQLECHGDPGGLGAGPVGDLGPV